MAIKLTHALAACLPLALALTVDAAAAPFAESETLPQSAGIPAKKPAKPMDMQQPMTTAMMKKGMTIGDVKKAADRRARQLQPKMEREAASMPPPDDAKP